MSKNGNFPYQNSRILLVVPHEDDDLNLFGGIFSQALAAGNQVFVCFFTNGDSDGYQSGLTRRNESLKYLLHCGLNKENIIFLGYGDSLIKDGVHVYNLDEEETCVSGAGKSETWGTEEYPDFSFQLRREHNSLCRKNMQRDLEDVLRSVLPAAVFCVDLDKHPDHRALSLMMDQVMASYVRNNPAYPDYYKGFAYQPAYTAAPDFYNTNLLSTKAIQDDLFYFWEERLRIPLADDYMTGYCANNPMLKEMRMFASQGVDTRFEKIVNADRVFWQRYLNPIMLGAKVTLNRKPTEKLNNGIICDSADITREILTFTKIGEDLNDGENEIVIDFAQAVSVKRIHLYGMNLDRLSEKNIRKKANAAVLDFADIKPVRQLKFTLCAGEDVHVTEIEIEQAKDSDHPLLALVEKDTDELIGRQIMPAGNEIHAALYMYPEMEASDVKIITSANVQCVREDDGYLLKLKDNRKGNVTIQYRDSEYTAVLYPNAEKKKRRLLQGLDRIWYHITLVPGQIRRRL